MAHHHHGVLFQQVGASGWFPDMAAGSCGGRLAACLLNVSEARRSDVVEAVARAALQPAQGQLCVLLHHGPQVCCLKCSEVLNQIVHQGVAGRGPQC